MGSSRAPPSRQGTGHSGGTAAPRPSPQSRGRFCQAGGEQSSEQKGDRAGGGRPEPAPCPTAAGWKLQAAGPALLACWHMPAPAPVVSPEQHSRSPPAQQPPGTLQPPSSSLLSPLHLTFAPSPRFPSWFAPCGTPTRGVHAGDGHQLGAWEQVPSPHPTVPSPRRRDTGATQARRQGRLLSPVPGFAPFPTSAPCGGRRAGPGGAATRGSHPARVPAAGAVSGTEGRGGGSAGWDGARPTPAGPWRGHRVPRRQPPAAAAFL